MSLLVAFSKNLKRQRLAKRLSQSGLAVRAQISVSYVSMLERGQRSPQLDTIDSIARALNTSAQKLLAA